MKKSFFTLMLLAVGSTLFAQTKSQNSFLLKPSHKMQWDKIQKLTNNHSIKLGNKPTEQKQRVIAQSYYEANLLEDSTSYSYSGTRGSNYNFYNLDFTYSRRFENEIPIIFSENTTDVLADTITHFSNSFMDEQYIGYYNINNQLDSFIFNSVNKYKITNTYNSLDVLESSTRAEYHPDETEVFKTIYIYENNSTKIISDTSFYKNGGAWEVGNFTVYQYNSLNLMDSIIEFWVNNSTPELRGLTVLAYDGNNNLDSFADYSWNGSSLELNTVNSMTHHPSYNGFATCKWTEYENGEPMETIDLQFIIGANNLPDSIIGRIYNHTDSIEAAGFITYSYNSSNSLVNIKQYIDGHTGEVNFYYEDYNATGINPSRMASFGIYPNPVKNHIIIQNTDSKLTGNWTISLADIQGRTLYQSQYNVNSGSTQIDLTDLPSGLYILNLKSREHGTISKKIIKQ